MVMIPRQETEIVSRIYAAIEEDQRRPMRLTRIGASGIGDECLRAIWYDWRGVANETINGRVLRLFETGHLQEARIVADLRRVPGIQVWDKDANGDQFTYTDETGHFVVKLDGVIKGVPGAEKTPHVLEIKTHNKSNFDALVKKGVLESKPDHFAQVQAGMTFSKLNRSLYVALCKDNEEYYAERIVEDLPYIVKLREKIKRVISSTIPPTRAFDPQKAFECKWCDSRAVCIGAKPLMNCRTCQRSEVLEESGAWVCTLYKTTLSSAEQLAGCPEHLPIQC